MTETSCQIASRDGFLLSAILLEPEKGKNGTGAIMLAGGTGIKKEFYLNFARFLVAHGFVVCLFDYRGIGGSRPASLRGFEARNHEWGMRDMAAVLDWLSEKFPDRSLSLIGHSAGGQQLGLMDNHHKLSKALLISSSTGYWKWLASPYRYLTLVIWYGVVPATNALLGFVPASWFGLGEDLPKGVAEEWRSWCLNAGYFGPFLGKSIPMHYFEQISIPLHFVYPEDDTIATDLTVGALQKFYSRAPTTTTKIVLSDYQLEKVGHLGFFSRKVKDTLWPQALTILCN